MINKIKKNNFKIFKEIISNKKVLFLNIFILIFYQLGTMITMQGIELSENYKINHSSFTGMLNLLSSGGLDYMNIFAIGLGTILPPKLLFNFYYLI